MNELKMFVLFTNHDSISVNILNVIFLLPNRIYFRFRVVQIKRKCKKKSNKPK